MKKALFTAILLSVAAGAQAATFEELAVNAAGIKAAAALNQQIPSASPFSQLADMPAKWYGADSRQARMHFSAYILYKVPAAYTGPVTQLLSDQAQKAKIRENIDLQLQHMYGAFTTHPAFENNPGIPSGDYKLTLTGAESAGNGYAKVSYNYEDVVVFSTKLFKGAGATHISFVLPKDPVTIYKKGFPTPSARKNRCTDDHYNSEGDFWYFWNPYQAGCPITQADLVTTNTDLTPLAVTRNTYPEYARLYGDNGNGDVLQVSYLVGIDESFQNGDLGKATFNNGFALLKAAGYRVTVDEPRRKQLVYDGPKKAHVQMLLLDPDSAEFASEAVKAMKTADVFLYDGHSGLGGYLSPERLNEDSGQQLALPQKKYQIFVFQGCSTYAYYNTAFFNLKKSAADPKGTKNLDIITTGIGAAFEVGAKVDAAFLTSVTMGQRPSWQEVMNRVHQAEGEDSALSHVNGDEDNPTSPN
jgi:hypothetical protein